MKEKETIEYLDIKSLVPFRNHPFKLRDGEEKEQLLQSIRTQGAIEPLIVRPLSESEYEVISGHRRNRNLIGQRYFDCMKAIVKNDAT